MEAADEIAMKHKRRINIGFLIGMLLATTIFVSCGKDDDAQAKKAQERLSKQIENGNVSNLSLTIYYLSPFYYTFAPLDVDELIGGYYEHKMVVDGNMLEEYIDLLNQISSIELIPVENESYIDARIYYVFEARNNRKIFDVAMWGDEWNVYVNGVEVKETDIFYDVIMPFLPEDAVSTLETVLGRGYQETV